MEAAIVFLPLVGFLIAGLFRKQIGDGPAMAVTTGLVAISALLSVIVFVDIALTGGEARTIVLARWVDLAGPGASTFTAQWSLRVDTLTAVMLVVVTGVSTLVHAYSIGYMDHDDAKARFFAYLSLFTFAMLMLVTADNFLQLFFGWEGVGLASYLLIGFWYKKASANAASIKAFVVNRVGDFGFALGIMAIFAAYGTIEFDPLFEAIKGNALVQPAWLDAPVAARDVSMAFLGMEFRALELIGFLLFIGAMGKSAQFFLHVWLPDAMEGPTPVSALIHAATMVTAGVFLVCRTSPIFEHAPAAAAVITVIGAVTALYAATVGMAQNDIKRVVAYSTCSQLGYMFFAAGVGSYGAAMFHLFTHAFFKALLFLGAGSVIHGLHEEQDMRKMGGVARRMPWTWAFMLIGTLALTGVGIPGTPIGFAGFFSKDRIIEDAFLAGTDVGMLAFWMGVIAAFLTSFYSWRLMFMTFHGKHRGSAEVYAAAHESPWIMRGPLLVLAVGAVLTGVVFYGQFVGKSQEGFWRDSLYMSYADLHNDDHGADKHGDAHGDAAHGDESHGGAAHSEAAGDAAHGGAEGAHDLTAADGGPPVYVDHHGAIPTWVLWAPVVVTALGFAFAWFFYGWKAGLGARIAATGGPIHAFLSNKWYFDEIYDVLFVKSSRALGDLFWKGGDRGVIDRFGPDGAAAAARRTAQLQSKLQSGYLYHYAFVMLAGVAVFATYILLSARGGGS